MFKRPASPQQLRARINRAYWFVAGVFVAAGPTLSLGGLVGAEAIGVVGVFGIVVLSITRTPGAGTFLIGLLIGLNISAIALMLWPPCRSILDFRVIQTPVGGIEVICVKRQDLRGIAILTFAGSVAIGLLLMLLGRIRQRGRPSS